MSKNFKLKGVLCVLMGYLSALALTLNLAAFKIPVTPQADSFIRLVQDFKLSMSGNSVAAVLLFVFLSVFYYKYAFGKTSVRQKVWSLILGGIFAFFMVMGMSFDIAGSMSLLVANKRNIVKTLVSFTGWVVLFYNVCNFFITALQKPAKDSSKKSFPQYDLKSFLICWAVIFVCWAGYIVIFYPGTSGPDVSNQIKEFYGFPDFFYRLSENKVSDTVFLTDHHPVAHTVVIGVFMKIGELFGYQNIGLLMLTLIQALATSATFAFATCCLAKRNVSSAFLKASTAFYALVPAFPLMAVNLSKNSLYSFWLVLYVICFFQYVEEPEKTQKSVGWNILLLVSVVCQMLFLKYGVYVVLASGLYLIIQQRKQWKTLVPILLIPVILFQTVYTNMLLPACGVSPGSSVEMLSVPFQQTARYVRDHGDDVTEEEYEVLGKMFKYEELPKVYNPENVDDVKWKGYHQNNGVSKAAYLKVWAKQLVRHPGCYIEATLNNVYGYFYPGDNALWFYYDLDNSCKNWRELDGVVDIGSADSFKPARTAVKNVVTALEKTPVFYLVLNGAFYIWTGMFLCILLLATKKFKYLAVMVPTAVTALFCVLSPVNAYPRYFQPIIYAAVFSAGVALSAVKNDKKPEEV